MKYYSEDTVRKIIRSVAHTALEQMNNFADSALAHQPSIELPDKYGDLIERDKLLEWQNITCIDTGMWQTDFDAVKYSVIKNAPVVLKASE